MQASQVNVILHPSICTIFKKGDRGRGAIRERERLQEQITLLALQASVGSRHSSNSQSAWASSVREVPSDPPDQIEFLGSPRATTPTTDHHQLSWAWDARPG